MPMVLDLILPILGPTMVHDATHRRKKLLNEDIGNHLWVCFLYFLVLLSTFSFTQFLFEWKGMEGKMFLCTPMAYIRNCFPVLSSNHISLGPCHVPLEFITARKERSLMISRKFAQNHWDPTDIILDCTLLY